MVAGGSPLICCVARLLPLALLTIRCRCCMMNGMPLFVLVSCPAGWIGLAGGS